MRNLRQLLVAGVMTPALVAGQIGILPTPAFGQQPEQKQEQKPGQPRPAAPPPAAPPRAAPPPQAPPVAPRPMPPAAPAAPRPMPPAPPPALPRPAPPVAPQPMPPRAAPPPPAVRPPVPPRPQTEPPRPAPLQPNTPAAPSRIERAPATPGAPAAPRSGPVERSPAPTLPRETAPPPSTPRVPPVAPGAGQQPPPPNATPRVGAPPAQQGQPAPPQGAPARQGVPASQPNAPTGAAPAPNLRPGQPGATPGALQNASPPSAVPGAPPQAAPPLRVPDGPPPGPRPTPLQPGAQPQTNVPAQPLQPQPQQQGGRGNRITPAGAAALGAAAGLVGGFMAERHSAAPRGLDAVRSERREFQQGDSAIFQEPGRTIVRDADRYFVRHDENERFRMLGANLQTQRRGDEVVSVWRRRDGAEIVTVTDANGDLIRRYRRMPDGAEVVIIDNRFSGPPRAFIDNVVVLPPPVFQIAPERYIVDADMVDERTLYDTLAAPPVAPIPRRFTLDEIRYSPDVRAYTRSVDVNAVNFDTNSWIIGQDQAPKLATLAKAINEAVGRNPNEVFLVEGHTDAVGNPVDNLSLSDRRAQSVADILTRDFAVPPENLVTQGYGAQNLRVQSAGAERRNRRVVIRRITPLLNGQNG